MAVPTVAVFRPHVPRVGGDRCADSARRLLRSLIAAGIGFAPLIPSWDGAGAAWTSFLPWTAVLLVLLGALSLIRRAWWACAAVLVAVLVWSAVFVPQLIPAAGLAGTADLTVATQNIGAANTDQAVAAPAAGGHRGRNRLDAGNRRHGHGSHRGAGRAVRIPGQGQHGRAVVAVVDGRAAIAGTRFELGQGVAHRCASSGRRHCCLRRASAVRAAR